MKRIAFLFHFILFWGFITGCSEGCIDIPGQPNESETVTQLHKLPITVIDVPPFWEKYEGLPKNGALFEIRTQEELSNNLNMISSEYIPDVDFSKYSVLMVLGEGYNSAREVTCELFQIDETRYILDINVVLTWQHSPGPWGQVIQVPVLPADAKIAVYTGYKVYENP